MIEVAFVFRQRYFRDLAAMSRACLGPIHVAGIVGSLADLRPVLLSRPVDMVVAGPTFIEGLASACRNLEGLPRPMTAVVHRESGSALVRSAQAFGVDFVASFAGGIGDMVKELVAAFESFDRAAPSRPATVAVTADAEPVAIWVGDDTDKEIVRLVAAGRSDREISDVLHYSNQTIRNRVSKILKQSDVSNRTHLASIYLNGIHAGRNPFVVESEIQRLRLVVRR